MESAHHARCGFCALPISPALCCLSPPVAPVYSTSPLLFAPNLTDEHAPLRRPGPPGPAFRAALDLIHDASADLCLPASVLISLLVAVTMTDLRVLIPNIKAAVVVVTPSGAMASEGTAPNAAQRATALQRQLVTATVAAGQNVTRPGSNEVRSMGQLQGAFWPCRPPSMSMSQRCAASWTRQWRRRRRRWGT
jgi:hypothetical protein